MPELRLNDGESTLDRLKDRLQYGYHMVTDQLKTTQLWYLQLSAGKQVLFGIIFLIAMIGIGFIVYFHSVFIKILIFIASKWENLPMGHVILFIMVFFVGFPPLLGFSPLSILCGMVYGVFGGWLLLITASISGSFVSFLVFRYLLKARAQKLLDSNEKFRAFAEILKQDQSLLLLILIRLCPLPYSLSNGALAAIPELSPLTYLLASIITCPKLFIHIFIGHQLKDIGDDANTTSGRIIDTISLIITALASATTMYIIYDKMQRKLDQFHHVNGNYTNNYHDENVIFGTFDDDDDSGNRLELDSTEFDADNFIIDDEPIDYDATKDLSQLPPKVNNNDKPLPPIKDDVDLEDDDDNQFNQDLNDVNARSYRDY